MTKDAPLREQLRKMLAWEDAHVGFDRAVADIPAELRGKQPAGVPYSPWQLLEHLRITQRDILEFCRNAQYQEKKWPDDYWPSSAAPPSPETWEAGVNQFRQDRKALEDLATDSAVDLFAEIPHGDGQTYLRELLLVADHTAYHVGELIVVRRLLGAWKTS
jgi:hypothetical protein